MSIDYEGSARIAKVEREIDKDHHEIEGVEEYHPVGVVEKLVHDPACVAKRDQGHEPRALSDRKSVV